MLLETATDIWDAFEQTYSKAKHEAQAYKVKVKTVAARQGDKTDNEYAIDLQSLWQEINHYWVVKTKCLEDLVSQKTKRYA